MTGFIDRAFWLMLTGLSGFAVHFLADMAHSIEQLNEKMIVVVSELEHHKDEDAARSADVELRLKALENEVDADRKSW